MARARRTPEVSYYDYINNELLEIVENKMVQDAEQYGDTFLELGLKGQYADIHRKVGPLKRALWDEIELPNEGPREICLDLIGHCLLTIALIDLDTEA
jgi:hypothetical protein